MIKYAKIINEETGLCEVGIGTNSEFYKSIGMIELDVDKSDKDNCWYLYEKCPHKSEEEKAEEERKRIQELRMTPLDFLKALETLGVSYETVKQILEANPLVEREMRYCQFVYRKHPMIEQFATQYGITSEQLDEMFIQANKEN